MIRSCYDIRVIYADTDMMGVVYYGKYFEYFEAARGHMLRKLGIPYREVERSGVYLPVTESHCRYRAPATFEDVLTIVCTIPHLPKSRIRIEYEVFQNGKEKMIAEGYTIHTFVNNQGRPVRAPEYFVERLAKHWGESLD